MVHGADTLAGGAPRPSRRRRHGHRLRLDSITVVDFDASVGPSEFANSAMTDWQRRVARRSGL
jgi:hypothetical protein